MCFFTFALLAFTDDEKGRCSTVWTVIKDKLILSAASLVAVATVALPAQAAEQAKWQQVGVAKTGGVSGIAVVQGTHVGRDSADVVIVRDNKNAGENRIATVRLRRGKAPVTTPLTWNGPLPVDVEGLDAVPGWPNHYIALASAGTAYHIVIAGGTATVQGRLAPLPDRKDGDNYESFALFRAGHRLFAIWATRGKNEEKSIVRTAPATIGKASFDIGAIADTKQFAVPYPSEDEVRHVSDLKVLRNGTILISSAHDPNDDNGPFSSAVYKAGRLSFKKHGKPVLELKAANRLRPLRKFTTQDDRKVEAVVTLPGGQAIWGTDDENLGGSLLFDRLH